MQATKKWGAFAVGLLTAAFFVWFGLRLLLANSITSDTILFIFGIASTLAGVFALSGKFSGRVVASLLLIAVGMYFFARAWGFVENSWLIRLLGLASILAAGVVVYVTMPRSTKNQPPDSLDG